MKNSQTANADGNQHPNTPLKVHIIKEGLKMVMTSNNMGFLVTKHALVDRAYLNPKTGRSWRHSYMTEYKAISTCKEMHSFYFEMDHESKLEKPYENEIYSRFKYELRNYLKSNNIKIIDED